VTVGSSNALDPILLGRIGDLELVSRILAEGLVSGLHRSPFHGYSAEFSQYRQYRPGDDLKYVDWKLVARTDRVYTKQFRETTNTAAMLVVDTSASMAFPEGPTSKLRYAVVASAALAHLISTQGDTVGLMTETQYLPANAGRHHLRRVLAGLSGVTGRGSWNPALLIRRAAERMGRRGLLFVFSDFYDDEDGTLIELRRASRLGHDIVVVQVISREELDFGYRRDVEFVDLENGRRLAVNAKEARRQYLDAIAAFLERWRLRVGAEGFQYQLMVTDTPHARNLRTLLLARQ
jgi:uncharacterized protein (DUF58 family)